MVGLTPRNLLMDINLKGKRALICGSTQGIGLAIAEELARLGATCVLAARSEDKLKAAVDLLSTGEGQVHQYRVADFSDPQAVHQMAVELAQSATIHILINNTGGPAGGPIIDATPQAFLDTFQQHLINNHQLTQALVPGMRSAGYGRIINIISTSVRIPLHNLGVSNTIRGAVASWAKTMANELGADGITVNNILPGATETQRLESIISNTAHKKNISEEAVRQEMLKDIPAKRFGKASELAAVAAFIASPAAAYVNGVSIPVDGGRTGSI